MKGTSRGISHGTRAPSRAVNVSSLVDSAKWPGQLGGKCFGVGGSRDLVGEAGIGGEVGAFEGVGESGEGPLADAGDDDPTIGRAEQAVQRTPTRLLGVEVQRRRQPALGVGALLGTQHQARVQVGAFDVLASAGAVAVGHAHQDRHRAEVAGCRGPRCRRLGAPVGCRLRPRRTTCP